MQLYACTYCLNNYINIRSNKWENDGHHRRIFDLTRHDQIPFSYKHKSYCSHIDNYNRYYQYDSSIITIPTTTCCCALQCKCKIKVWEHQIRQGAVILLPPKKGMTRERERENTNACWGCWEQQAGRRSTLYCVLFHGF